MNKPQTTSWKPAPVRVAREPEDSSSLSSPAESRRCQMAIVAGSTDWLSKEMVALLHHRLALAALIALGPNVVFLVWNLFQREKTPWFGLTGMIFQTLVVVIVGTLAVILWRNRPLSPCRLRYIEVTLFGIIAAFFAWLHYVSLARAEFLEWVEPGSDAAEAILGLVVSWSCLRWFFLIVLYGVFIPNTWERCATLAGGAGAIAIILTAVAGFTDAQLRPMMFPPLLITTVVMLAAVAVAVFGSSRIHFLQEEANEARKLGQYRLQAPLGSGGMGKVYLAEHTLLRRPCAIKLIHPEQTRDGVSLSRFEREVRAMASLTHWNTVEIFDYGQTEDGAFYYVMEYLPGQNLDKLVLNNGPLPPGRVVHLLRQVCFALREAHSIGLLHRDIKPSNIIACDRGGIHDVVKLLDFGLVQCLGKVQPSHKLTLQGTILGSPPYMSPEQARGRNDLHPASDIYSVGGVAYYLLTGQPPFVRETAMELLIAHVSEPLVPPRQLRPEIPEDLEAVVLRCLEKEPIKRFADAESLARALGQCGCAGAWTEEMAAEWWHNHGETVGVVPPGKAETDQKTTSMAMMSM